MVWTDSGQCSTCRHCAIDMDMEPFCMHPEVINAGHTIGLYINKALNSFCKNDEGELALREYDGPYKNT